MDEQSQPVEAHITQSIEHIDDQSIIEMMTGNTVEDYVYSFKQGGKTIEGLTIAGVNEAANRRGGIHITELTHTDTDHSWFVIAKAVDKITASSRFGAFEQPKQSGGRDDPHAFSKAVHKAQRNAIKQLLPIHITKSIIAKFKGQPLPKAPEQKALPPAETGKPQKAAFASAKALTDRLSSESIPKETFWDFVKAVFKVESRNDMTDEQWVELKAKMDNAKINEEAYDQMKGNINKWKESQESQKDATNLE